MLDGQLDPNLLQQFELLGSGLQFALNALAFFNLTLQLESNDVDTSIVSQGIPSVNRRSIQTKLLLNEDPYRGQEFEGCGTQGSEVNEKTKGPSKVLMHVLVVTQP